jgi:hypothetical protein
MKFYCVFAMNSIFCIIAASSSRSIVMQWSRSLQRSDPKKRLFSRADAAQKRHNVVFVLVDGVLEGGSSALTVGRRLKMKHKIRSNFNM